MINVISVYNDVALDNSNHDENGNLSYAMFNRLSRRAELRLIDYLTGHVSGDVKPLPYLFQKNKDLLMDFIVESDKHVTDGVIEKPADYYTYDNITNFQSVGCSVDDTDAPSSPCKVVVDILDGSQFNSRCKSFIKGLRPSDGKPIAKQNGRGFVFQPKDIGDVTLEYIRYPKFAEIKTKEDLVYHDQIPDELSSQHYEWPEAVRESLVWIITDLFATHTRERALKESNLVSGKTEGDRR